MHKKLGLGTVQFGFNYGISNTLGKVNNSSLHKIISLLKSSDIDTIDTSFNYGDSESRIGRYSNDLIGFKIVTKAIPIKSPSINDEDVLFFSDAFNQSLKNLNFSSVYALLIHQAPDLLKPGCSKLISFLQSLRNNGIVQKVGVSVYSQDELKNIINSGFIPDIVQIPLNIFDQGILKDNFLPFLKGLGIEIHVRSAYLQGLIFMDPAKLSSHFDNCKELLNSLQLYIQNLKVTPAQYALSFLNRIQEIDKIIIGVQTVKQLQEVLEYDLDSDVLKTEDFTRWEIRDTQITNPSKWVR